MKLTSYAQDALKLWKAEATLSRFLIIVCLAMVIFAYLPTCQIDYVTQDQWRAFRYSTLEGSWISRGEACQHMVRAFYVFTGRPLVWLGELLEHAVVGKIRDFIYLRPVVLVFVVISVLYLGRVIAPLVNGWVGGVVVASLFVLGPGYSFIYFQGMTGAPVLLSIPLSAASFSKLNKWSYHPEILDRKSLKQLFISLMLFLSACMLYPAWAFIVVPLGWCFFCLYSAGSPGRRFKRFLLTMSFYFLATIIYYLFVKVSVILLTWMGAYVETGNYTVSMSLRPSILYDRLVIMARYFYDLRLFSFQYSGGLSVFILTLFSIHVAVTMTKNSETRANRTIVWSAGVFLLTIIILAGSVSPWFFSNMPGLSNRHLIPWYFFFFIDAVILIQYGLGQALKNNNQYVSILLIILILTPMAFCQNRLSFLEVASSNMEIEIFRSELGKWLDKKGYESQRYLLVVRPQTFSSRLIEGQMASLREYAGENLSLSSACHPEHIYQMVNALLRERNDHPLGKSVEIVDCRFDRTLAENKYTEGKVALLQTNGENLTINGKNPYIINLSLLTSKPVFPKLIESSHQE
ncbi:conserved hypothetical protein, membrane [Candidatus Omnitrophus magneticus]|uniref:Glycosyltransferase RgtA/B/C/D-like domain-containing protein n=1 Tax=Candidatus Omnitrophus magneticus TaxID=1609969 RepID=A0A0F0CNC0_9BACT|nr:conserved hypothetical protein, membrane [Candidatus Omnitrophus magneticus]